MVGVSKIAGDMYKAQYDVAGNGKIDKDKLDGIEQGLVRKKKSDTLKHSHDAEAQITADHDTYQEAKRITFTTGLKGAIRVKWDCNNNGSGTVLRGWSRLVDKEGTVIGTDGYDNGNNNTTVFTRTEDIDVANYNEGDYIIVQAKNHTVESATLKIDINNFRIYYDENSEDFVNV